MTQEEFKTKFIKARVTPAQRTRFKFYAYKDDLSLSEFILDALEEKIKRMDAEAKAKGRITD